MYSKLDRLEKNGLNLPVNAGSCVKLASYLNKELDDDKQFFSHHEDAVTLKEVVEKISSIKGEPKWMLDFRLKSGEILFVII